MNDLVIVDGLVLLPGILGRKVEKRQIFLNTFLNSFMVEFFFIYLNRIYFNYKIFKSHKNLFPKWRTYLLVPLTWELESYVCRATGYLPV